MQNSNKKGEGAVRVCDVDQSLGDTQGSMAGKTEGENTVSVDVATEGVRPVQKEKGRIKGETRR